MVGVRLRQSRLCDVPIGSMSEKDAAKFNDLVADWLSYRGRIQKRLDKYLDFVEFRKFLTPCELEILECRYSGHPFEKVAEMLQMNVEDVHAVLMGVAKKARRMDVTNLGLTLFERELIGVRENKQLGRRSRKVPRKRLTQIFVDIEKRERRQ
mgnify:CR=1 FL=1